MRIFCLMSVLLLGYGCSDNNDEPAEAPLHHYKEALDNAKMAKQLQEDTNLQRIPKETD